MKTFLKEKSWLFTLSVAFIASSAWSSASAQDPAPKTETKVTIIQRTSNENTEVFAPKWEQKTHKDHTSKTYSWTWSSSDDKSQSSNKPKLGVLLKGSESGTVILKTFPNSAAAEAGLQSGDRILRINGKATESIDGLIAIIGDQKVGDKVKILYARDGKKFTRSATLKSTQQDHYLNYRTNFKYYKSNTNSNQNLSEKPCEQLNTIYGKPFLGVYLSNPHQEEGTGALLSSVIDNTGASEANLQARDKITKMDNTPVSSTKEAIKYIQSKKPGDKLKIHLIRDGKTMTIKAILGSWADSPNYTERVRILEENCDRETATLETPEEPVKETQNARTEPSTTTAFEQEAVMQVFPNPTSDVVNIKFEGEKAPLTINIVGLDGKALYTKTIQSFGGTYNDQLDLSTYPAGVYIVNLIQNDKQLSQQVVVE